MDIVSVLSARLSPFTDGLTLKLKFPSPHPPINSKLDYVRETHGYEECSYVESRAATRRPKFWPASSTQRPYYQLRRRST